MRTLTTIAAALLLAACAGTPKEWTRCTETRAGACVAWAIGRLDSKPLKP